MTNGLNYVLQNTSKNTFRMYRLLKTLKESEQSKQKILCASWHMWMSRLMFSPILWSLENQAFGLGWAGWSCWGWDLLPRLICWTGRRAASLLTLTLLPVYDIVKRVTTFQGCIRINKIPKRPWGINYYCHPKRERYKNKLSFLAPGLNRRPSDTWKWAWNGIWVTHTSPWPVPNLTNLGNILSFSLLALLYWNIYSSNVFWCLWVLKTFTILQASPGWMNKNRTQFSLSAEELFQ